MFLSVWRHVDKGTPEGAIDAMLVHGQGKEKGQVLAIGLKTGPQLCVGNCEACQSSSLCGVVVDVSFVFVS